MVSYWTAYLKANYPAEYMAAVLTSVRDDKDKTAVYLAECRRMGITVLPPDVNESVRNFAPVGDDIRFGLGAIRNVGVNVVDAIVAARKEKGEFTDFSDFLRKVDAVVCNKKVVESLIKAGAFDSLRPHPQGPAARARRRHRRGDEHEEGRVDRPVRPVRLDGRLRRLRAGRGVRREGARRRVGPKHRLAVEREMLGLYVSGHPLHGVEQALAAKADIADRRPSSTDDRRPTAHQVTVGGILTGVNRRVNKNGEPWASAQLEDLAGGIEVLFFPRCYQVVGVDVAEDAIVLVKARVNRRDDRVSLIANDLAVPELAAPGEARAAGRVSLRTRAVHPAAGGEAQGGADAPPRARPRCT